MNNTEIIELAEGETLNYTQGNPSVLVRLRWWLIEKIAGQMPVVMNLVVYPHNHTECAQEFQIDSCRYALFSKVMFKSRHGYGITFKGKK